jgi:hypothetical protein
MSKNQSNLQEQINWYLSLLVLILFIILPPILFGLFYLSRVPDVSWGTGDNLSYTRIWMYRERRPLGVAYENRQVVKQYSSTEVCIQHKLGFLLWGQSREAKPSTSRRTMVLVNDRWQPTGEACR